MSTGNNDNDSDSISNNDICANCGKEGCRSDMNSCNKCKSVKYCNAACKKKHRSKHKKACERHVAELYDEVLFKQPPPLHEDCPIFFLRMPMLPTGWRYYSCCGKAMCCGCIHAVALSDGGVGLCPFCRTPAPTSEKEAVKRAQKLADAGDAQSIGIIGTHYATGTSGFQKDLAKAYELWYQAGDLGRATAYTNMADAYAFGLVKVDKDRLKITMN